MLKENPFFAALRFLTILPLPDGVGSGERGLLNSVTYFPLVGLLLGTFAYVLGLIFWSFCPPLLASVLAVLSLVFFSGALHLDGLADSADGFFSARPPEKILLIMRDSRIGVMGVFGVVAVLLIKIASLAGMSGRQAVASLFIMPVAGRALMVAMMAFLPYARAGGGLASIFYQRSTKWKALFSLAVLGLSGFILTGWPGFVAVFSACCVVCLFAFYCKQKIGGATGDTLGASCELAEMIVALFFAIFPLHL